MDLWRHLDPPQMPKARVKQPKEKFTLPKRELSKEDFILGNAWTGPKQNEDEPDAILGSKWQTPGQGDPALWMHEEGMGLPKVPKRRIDDHWAFAAVLYEYARESRRLRQWAMADVPENTADVESVELGKKMERVMSPSVHAFLWILREELAKDTPWLLVPEDMRECAPNATSIASCLGEYFHPHVLRPATQAEIAAHQPKKFEDFSYDAVDHQSPKEIISFKIDWAGATNAELAGALAYYRPSKIPEPMRDEKERRGRKSADRLGGRLKSNDCLAALKNVMVLRLAHLCPEATARALAEEKLSIPADRKDNYEDCIKSAGTTFQKLYGWLDEAKPVSARKHPK